jgi:hypothetical protein
MQRLFNWFCNRPASSRCAARRAPSCRPQLEALEAREVLSTATAAPHAVMQSSGQSMVFYINSSDHAFYKHDANGTRLLSGPGTVQKFSAGLDASGKADVFVESSDGGFYVWNASHGWQSLLGSGYGIGDFAAVNGGRAYVQFSDGSVYESFVDFQYQTYFVGHWMAMFGSGTVIGNDGVLDAVTDWYGNDALFAIRYDGSLQEYYHGHWNFVDWNTQHGFSAGTDTNGRPDLYGLDSRDGSFWKWSQYSGWGSGPLALPGVVSRFSATNNGTVWFDDFAGNLGKFDGTNSRTWVDTGGGAWTLTAASSTDVYADWWGSSLWEVKNSSTNEQFIDSPVQPY